MKRKLISMLKKAGAPLSGELLGGRLGVSRVAVWKHIASLRRLGYPIHGGPRGYTLAGEPDSLCSWELPELEGRYRYFEVLDSTMAEAMRIGRAGGADGTVIVAGRQTAGRGRMGRSWVSSPGGLYLTLVLRRAFPLAAAGRYALAAGAAAAEAVQAVCGLKPSLKWPNDILLGDRKLGGVLLALLCEGDRVNEVHVGLGLNVNSAPPQGACLRERSGRSLRRAELLRAFLQRFSRMTADPLVPEFKQRWTSFAGTIGRQVRISEAGGSAWRGTAVGIEEHGGLLVRTPAGRTVSVLYGDCAYAGRERKKQ